MTRQLLFIAGTAVAVTLLAGCSQDNTTEAPDTQPKKKENMTAFVNINSTPSTKASTRMTGKYTGSKIEFSWTPGDRLWIDANGMLKIDDMNDIDATKRNAWFYFDGSYTAPSYPVRFTGSGSKSDEVTIKASQAQAAPNDAAHLGTDGDCGTAIATRDGNEYNFILDHKASYITFAPFYSKEQLASDVTVTSITVSADEDIAGTYPFGNNGLQTASVTNPSKSITLTLTGSFPVPTASDYTKNGAYMVIQPGTFHNLKVEYKLKDNKTGNDATLSKTYAQVTFSPGKNKPIRFDLDIERYEMDYALWDAKKTYYDGYTGTLPVNDGDVAKNPNAVPGNERYNNTIEPQPNGRMDATNLCAVSPNVNELSYYVWTCDPHWDGERAWVMNGHIYKGGMWFKKLKYSDVGSFTSTITEYKNYGDYRLNHPNWDTWNGDDPSVVAQWTVSPVTQGNPNDTKKYFFLPAKGYITDNGVLDMHHTGYAGAYWSSTGTFVNGTNHQAISLHFSKDVVGIDSDLRVWAYPTFKVVYE